MNTLYQRNLIKEELQDVLLNFIYNSEKYKNLIFTGGTCLRKLYSLPRLSEDLDFDFQDAFSSEAFAEDVQTYLRSEVQLSPVEVKVANNKRTVFVKFIQKSKEVIFVRCDFSPSKIRKEDTEVNPYYGKKYNFFIRNYTLKALFTNKMRAFLELIYFKGDAQEISFKGRDVFDIVWFIQLSAKSRFDLRPDWERLEKELQLGKQEIINRVIEKASAIKEDDVRADLSAFIERDADLQGFLESYEDVVKSKLKYLI